MDWARAHFNDNQNRLVVCPHVGWLPRCARVRNACSHSKRMLCLRCIAIDVINVFRDLLKCIASLLLLRSNAVRKPSSHKNDSPWWLAARRILPKYEQPGGVFNKDSRWPGRASKNFKRHELRVPPSNKLGQEDAALEPGHNVRIQVCIRPVTETGLWLRGLHRKHLLKI